MTLVVICGETDKIDLIGASVGIILVKEQCFSAKKVVIFLFLLSCSKAPYFPS